MQSIPAKDAVRRAKESLIDLYQDDKPKALALEEIELVKDGDRSLWSVTLGFHRPKSVSAVSGGSSAFSLAGYGAPPAQVEHRVYKTVFIDASTGEFVKMDIRQVQ
jgi:hypothetical protein